MTFAEKLKTLHKHTEAFSVPDVENVIELSG